MKNYIYLITFTIFIGLIITINTLVKKNNNLEIELSYSKANEKAFILENNDLKDNNRIYQLTINQLNCINDSLLAKVDSIRKELNIKDKNLQYLSYILSEAKKKDTVIFRDTIFKENTDIDTIIKDDWYNLDLKLKYPNRVIVRPMFISELNVIINYKKETINPPKKCWLARLFQKKHKVIEVNVLEKSPYITIKKKKFVKIIK